MSQISPQSGPKISLAVAANMFWDLFFVTTSSTLQTCSRIDCFRTHRFPRFLWMWSFSLYEMWNVEDLQKQISSRRFDSNPPPSLVNWNPGHDPNNEAWLPSYIEKWSKKTFLQSENHFMVTFLGWVFYSCAYLFAGDCIVWQIHKNCFMSAAPPI